MKEKKQLGIKYFGASDIGLVRTENQDSFGKFPKDDLNMYQSKGILFMVADGMGGHTGGKEASQTAVDVVGNEYFSFDSEIISSALLYSFKKANYKINQTSQEALQFRKKGTTCSALVIENDRAHIAHVGDSRIYKISDDSIVQFTNDHTEVGEMVRKKIITEEEAKNHPSKSILIRAMGIETDLEVDLIENIFISRGDCFVLCSDGLSKVLPEEIKKIVLSNPEEEACKKLISLANDRGGNDNVTVLVIKIVDEHSNDNQIRQTPAVKKKNSWFSITVLLLMVILIAVFVLIFQKEITGLFSKKNITASDSTEIKQEIIPHDNPDALLTEANNLLSEGKLDSAMVLYNLILNQNPLHIGALNGREQVVQKYIRTGNDLLAVNKKDEALLNFKKAFTLDPNDKELNNKIMVIEKSFNKDLSKDDKTTRVNKDQQKKLPDDQTVTKDNNGKEIIFADFNLGNWERPGLSGSDFKDKGSGVVFLKTNKSKKIFYKQAMEDIDLNVDVSFDDHSNENAGVIIGYNKNENNGTENYYLFTLNSSRSYSLIKVNDDKKETIVTGKQIMDTGKNGFQIKLKCLGPWIMIYNDNKLLESYLGSDFIKGKFGFFADSNVEVEFSNLVINSAFEK
ncbi:MAG: protein phosphatase 2C domain-containing protein [Ignavibacterium sp.]|nr:protein phosphatase 2C domain-containing protein [Ignavibacterium sp.]MDX9712201.1 protein phosphatase 2C domain-containing protein [Ignavibacteriaceae bacterium]